MAVSSYLIYYRGRTGEQLLADQATLNSQISVFTSQGMGSKNFQRDLDALNDRLSCIQYVINERNPAPILRPPTGNIGVGFTDFGRLQD